MEKWKIWVINFSKSVKNWLIVILIVIIGILLLMRSCSKKPCAEIQVTPRTEIIIRTSLKDTTIYKPVPIYTKGKDSVVYIISKMDSIQLAEIVKLYFETKFYHLVLKNDSSGFAEVYMQVYQNLIEVLKYKDSSKCKEEINVYNMIPAERFKLYLGLQANLLPFGPAVNVDLAPGLIMTYKNWGFTANYGLFEKSINAGLFYKISLRKKK